MTSLQESFSKTFEGIRCDLSILVLKRGRDSSRGMEGVGVKIGDSQIHLADLVIKQYGTWSMPIKPF